MCGLNVIFSANQSYLGDPAHLIREMNQSIEHRGPDDNSFEVVDDHCALGHVRLSVLDTSARSNQPFKSTDGRYAIVFNGEIYNFREIRDSLELECSTSGDTEVLLKGFEKLGLELLPLLNGMFALAIYDKVNNELTLARDRFGVKPLYYSRVEKGFVATSEIKAFFSVPSISKKFNAECISDFLTFLCLPNSETFYEGIYKVLPGETIVVSALGELKRSQYAEPFQKDENKTSFTESALKNAVFEAVQSQSVSDVPVGVFLSGGVDSNAILEATVDLKIKPKVFSADYESDHGSYISEKGLVARSAAKHSLDVELVNITRQQFWSSVDDILYHQDEPLADPVSVPIYFLARKVRESGIKVILVGEGADEIFLGYPAWNRLIALHKISLTLQKFGLYKILYPLYPITRVLPTRYREAARRYLDGLPQFWGGTDAVTYDEKKTIGISDLALKRTDRLIADFFKAYNKITDPKKSREDWFTYIDLKVRLPELMLMRVDKMAMAWGVETRVPFLDNKLTRAAINLPLSQKIADGVNKSLFKKSMSDIISNDILYRKKAGFNAPAEEWCLEDAERVSREIQDFCNSTELLDYDAVYKICSKKPRHFWRFYVLARWYRLQFS